MRRPASPSWLTHICGVEARRDTSELELKRNKLLATDEMEPEGRLGTGMKAATAAGPNLS
jgi:hypothetical protein